MQCYQYLAAITAVSMTIDSIPGIHHRLPHNVIADWMAENDIESDDVLLASPAHLRSIIESLIRQNQPQVLHAA